MSEKVKGTLIHIGNTATATSLVTAVTAATIEFECAEVTSINGLGLGRETQSEEESMCADATSYTPDDTGKLTVSNFTLEGKTKNADAAQAQAETMILADTEGVLVITEPNGTDKLWFLIKFVKFEYQRGGPNDIKKFSLECIARTLPKDV